MNTDNTKILVELTIVGIIFAMFLGLWLRTRLRNNQILQSDYGLLAQIAVIIFVPALTLIIAWTLNYLWIFISLITTIFVLAFACSGGQLLVDKDYPTDHNTPPPPNPTRPRDPTWNSHVDW